MQLVVNVLGDRFASPARWELRYALRAHEPIARETPGGPFSGGPRRRAPSRHLWQQSRGQCRWSDASMQAFRQCVRMRGLCVVVVEVIAPIRPNRAVGSARITPRSSIACAKSSRTRLPLASVEAAPSAPRPVADLGATSRVSRPPHTVMRARQRATSKKLRSTRSRRWRPANHSEIRRRPPPAFSVLGASRSRVAAQMFRVDRATRVERGVHA